jgi:hypothetical protein
MENTIYYFKTAGPENTNDLLKLAKKRVLERGITQVVVASLSGETGVRTAEVFKDTNVNVIVVPHQTGLRGPGVQELTEENRRRLEELGAKIVICTHAFGGISRSVAVRASRKPGESPAPPPSRPAYIPPIGDLVARVLRLFCQGMKVCVEITMMAADAGAIAMDRNVVAIGGTIRGADTAILLKPAHSFNLFNIEAQTHIDIHEIIAKPYSTTPTR